MVRKLRCENADSLSRQMPVDGKLYIISGEKTEFAPKTFLIGAGKLRGWFAKIMARGLHASVVPDDNLGCARVPYAWNCENKALLNRECTVAMPCRFLPVITLECRNAGGMSDAEGLRFGIWKFNWRRVWGGGDLCLARCDYTWALMRTCSLFVTRVVLIDDEGICFFDTCVWLCTFSCTAYDVLSSCF